MRRLFNAALLLSLFVTTGRAQTIVYDNGPAINAYGELIGGGGWNYGADFSFNEFTRFDGIRFSSYQYGLGPPTNWYWYIRDASWQLLASGTGYSQQMQIYPACCYAPYRYQNDLTISELGLSADQYWLTLSAPESEQYVWWDRADANGTLPGLLNGYSFDQEVSFQLTQSRVVPEPTPIGLLAGGFALLGAFAHQRGRRRVSVNARAPSDD